MPSWQTQHLKRTSSTSQTGLLNTPNEPAHNPSGASPQRLGSLLPKGCELGEKITLPAHRSLSLRSARLRRSNILRAHARAYHFQNRYKTISNNMYIIRIDCIKSDTAYVAKRAAVSALIQYNILKYNIIHTTLYRFYRFRCESVSILKPIQNGI